MITSTRSRLLIGGAYALVLLFTLLPVLSLILSAADYPLSRGEGSVVLSALLVSLRSTALTMGVLLFIGTPAAYGAARLDFRGKRVIEILLNLPLILPPAVAGLLLLMTFGRMGWMGRTLSLRGIDIPFTLGAVVMAQLFTALPLYVKTVAEGFSGVDRRLEMTAMTLGDSPLKAFFRVTLPLSAGSLAAGAIMGWARAMAEFGATIMFAGNLKGKTQTLPLAIYSAMESDMAAALNMARLMLLFSLALLFSLYIIRDRKKTAPASRGAVRA